MTQLTERGGAQDTNSSDPLKSADEIFDYPKDAEKVNGRWAMLGFLALVGAYVTTGQIIPGIF